jgi:hypothetical protein
MNAATMQYRITKQQIIFEIRKYLLNFLKPLPIIFSLSKELCIFIQTKSSPINETETKKNVEKIKVSVLVNISALRNSGKHIAKTSDTESPKLIYKLVLLIILFALTFNLFTIFLLY